MNITVPQRDCTTAAAPAQVRECRVVEEVVTKPVCVTIMDKEVIEVTASLKCHTGNVLSNTAFNCPFSAELHGAGGGWRVLRGEVRQRDAARAEQAVHHRHGGAVHRHPRPGDTHTQFTPQPSLDMCVFLL